MARAPTRDIEAMVQTVDEKHVRVPFFAQQRPRPIGEASASVTRQVRGTAIGLGLDDPCDEHPSTGSPLVDEQTADESPRQDKGVAGVPRARVAMGAKRSGVVGESRHGADVTQAGDGRRRRRRRRRTRGPNVCPDRAGPRSRSRRSRAGIVARARLAHGSCRPRGAGRLYRRPLTQRADPSPPA